MILIYIILVLCILFVLVWCYLYYPKQIVKYRSISQVELSTPKDNKSGVDYHDDCLHPCVRLLQDGSLVMVQSPWYMYNDGVENPILYKSNDPLKWHNGIEVEPTPPSGYNSDPNVFVENGRIYVFWREVRTAICNQYGTIRATVGRYTDDGIHFSEKQVYLTCDNPKIDNEICPILIKKDNKYLFYASWYETQISNRHNLGISIWEGSNLEKPDFTLVKQVPFATKNICDKKKQISVFNHLVFIPYPHKFDLWHFDIFEWNNRLYMVAAEEMKDVVMLAVAEDWINFKLIRKPLLNAHYMENYVGYRQRYYKPTAFVNDKDKNLHLYFTANPRKQYAANKLYHATIPLSKLNKLL